MQSILALIKSFIEKILFFLRLRGVGPVIVDPETDEPAEFPFTEVVDYYGCPNSNKARKLQLSRKHYR